MAEFWTFPSHQFVLPLSGTSLCCRFSATQIFQTLCFPTFFYIRHFESLDFNIYVDFQIHKPYVFILFARHILAGTSCGKNSCVFLVSGSCIFHHQFVGSAAAHETIQFPPQQYLVSSSDATHNHHMANYAWPCFFGLFGQWEYILTDMHREEENWQRET